MTAIRHRVFMPPKMQKVPRMTLPDFRTKRKTPKRAGNANCVGGPWDGMSIKGVDTIVFKVGGFCGRYLPQGHMGTSIWQDVQPTNGIGI